MQILANALPGFRDMRAPLTAGYMWLLFAWLLVQPDPNVRPDNAIAGSLWDLGHRIGPIWVALAVGTAAYLVGALSQIAASIIGWLVAKAIDALPLNIASALGSLVRVDSSESGTSEREMLTARGNTRTHQLMDRAWRELQQKGRALDRRRRKVMAARHEAIELDDEAASEQARSTERSLDNRIDDVENLGRDLRQAYDRAEARSIQETDLPATLLVGQQPELFAEVDRLRAEGDLRLAVVPPLLALTVLLVVRSSWWWAFLAVAAVGLAVQGVYRTNQSRRVILDAIRTGRIDSPSAKEFSEWLTSDFQPRLEQIEVPPMPTPMPAAATAQ